jgi:hypothetical protein
VHHGDGRIETITEITETMADGTTRTSSSSKIAGTSGGSNTTTRRPKQPNQANQGSSKPTTARSSDGAVSPASGGTATSDAFQNADKSKWKVKEYQFAGAAKMESVGKQETVQGSIAKGKKHFLANPTKYVAMIYQNSMLTNPAWTEDQQKYTYIHREGSVGYRPQGVSPNGWMTLFMQEYQRLPPFPSDELPKQHRDKYTDTVLARWNGKKLEKPFLPGRGMGVGDAPNLKIIGDVDPSDVNQVRARTLLD